MISPVTCSSNNTACENIDDNLIDAIGGIANVEECRQMCYNIDDCEFFTYYGNSSFPLRNVCFLFQTCEETISCTGKSLSEALIFASTNPQYDDRLFIELQVQYMKIPSSNLGRTCCV